MIKRRRERVWKKCGAKRRYQIVFKKVEILEIVQIKHTYILKCAFQSDGIEKTGDVTSTVTSQNKVFFAEKLTHFFFCFVSIFFNFVWDIFFISFRFIFVFCLVFFWFCFRFLFLFFSFILFWVFFFIFFFFNFKETFASAFHVKLYQIGVRIVGCHCY